MRFHKIHIPHKSRKSRQTPDKLPTNSQQVPTSPDKSQQTPDKSWQVPTSPNKPEGHWLILHGEMCTTKWSFFMWQWWQCWCISSSLQSLQQQNCDYIMFNIPFRSGLWVYIIVGEVLALVFVRQSHMKTALFDMQRWQFMAAVGTLKP